MRINQSRSLEEKERAKKDDLNLVVDPLRPRSPIPEPMDCSLHKKRYSHLSLSKIQNPSRTFYPRFPEPFLHGIGLAPHLCI